MSENLFLETKALLENLRKAKRLCLRFRQEINEVRNDYGALTSCLGSLGNIRSSDRTSTTERMIERLENKQEKFENKLTEFMELEDKLNKVIDKLSPYEQEIIIGYYMQDRTHYQLASECYCSEETTYRVKKRAIKKIGKYLQVDSL